VSKSEYVKSFSVSQVEGFFVCTNRSFQRTRQTLVNHLRVSEMQIPIEEEACQIQKEVVSVEMNGSLLRDMIALCQES